LATILQPKVEPAQGLSGVIFSQLDGEGGEHVVQDATRLLHYSCDRLGETTGSLVRPLRLTVVQPTLIGGIRHGVRQGIVVCIGHCDIVVVVVIENTIVSKTDMMGRAGGSIFDGQSTRATGIGLTGRRRGRSSVNGIYGGKRGGSEVGRRRWRDGDGRVKSCHDFCEVTSE
jgi:hypothetical protein